MPGVVHLTPFSNSDQGRQRAHAATAAVEVVLAAAGSGKLDRNDINLMLVDLVNITNRIEEALVPVPKAKA